MDAPPDVYLSARLAGQVAAVVELLEHADLQEVGRKPSARSCLQ
jgi:hypothetical protein